MHNERDLAHFGIKNTGAIPMHRMQAIFFDGTPKDIVINNGHISLRIPSETIQKISKLPPESKARLMAKMSNAFRDSSSLSIEKPKLRI